MTQAELIAAVKAHAYANYAKDGWDYVVECYEDGEIAEVIQGETTIEGAIAQMKEVVSLLDERRRDIESERW